MNFNWRFITFVKQASLMSKNLSKRGHKSFHSYIKGLLQKRKICPVMTVLRPIMQTEATLLANNTQHCWAQHVASVSMEPQQCWHLSALVAYSLKPVKLLGPCKRTQHWLLATNPQQHATMLWLVASVWIRGLIHLAHKIARKIFQWII